MTKSMLYVAFAVVATIVNLCTQEITHNLYNHKYELMISMFSGTLAGLIVKYVLDKKFIFNFTSRNVKQDATTFFFYSLLGGATTIIFWVTEFAFDIWFQSKTMRYVGAVLGLSIGYITKYYLDKKFVFIER